MGVYGDRRGHTRAQGREPLCGADPSAPLQSQRSAGPRDSGGDGSSRGPSPAGAPVRGLAVSIALRESEKPQEVRLLSPPGRTWTAELGISRMTRGALAPQRKMLPTRGQAASWSSWRERGPGSHRCYEVGIGVRLHKHTRTRVFLTPSISNNSKSPTWIWKVLQ